MSKLFSVAFVLLALTACTTSTQPASKSSLAGIAAGESTAAWKIDSEHSLIRILVFRSGPMAKFGHDHVLSMRPERGDLDKFGSADASAVLQFSVASLSVDADADRQWSGYFAEAKSISDSDKVGTLKNLLGEDLLDAQNFPVLQVAVKNLKAFGDAWLGTVTFTVKGEEHEILLPFNLQENEGALRVQSHFVLDHAQLGLRPFSAFGGAVRVADSIAFNVDLLFVKKSE